LSRHDGIRPEDTSDAEDGHSSQYGALRIFQTFWSKWEGVWTLCENHRSRKGRSRCLRQPRGSPNSASRFSTKKPRQEAPVNQGERDASSRGSGTNRIICSGLVDNRRSSRPQWCSCMWFCYWQRRNEMGIWMAIDGFHPQILVWQLLPVIANDAGCGGLGGWEDGTRTPGTVTVKRRRQ
jgi:hypothetical protein